ncbi:MAG: GYD domain-containing protein [Alphaproteobacteria bacterium]
MPMYITLLNWTDQGIRNIKESPKRLDAARKAVEDAGGDLGEVYMTMGAYDLVAVSHFPSDEAAATFALGTGSGGNVRSTTLKAFPESEYRRIIDALP